MVWFFCNFPFKLEKLYNPLIINVPFILLNRKIETSILTKTYLVLFCWAAFSKHFKIVFCVTLNQN